MSACHAAFPSPLEGEGRASRSEAREGGEGPQNKTARRAATRRRASPLTLRSLYHLDPDTSRTKWEQKTRPVGITVTVHLIIPQPQLGASFVGWE